MRIFDNVHPKSKGKTVVLPRVNIVLVVGKVMSRGLAL